MTVETIRACQKNVVIMFLAEFMRDHPSYAKYVDTLVNLSKIGFREDVTQLRTMFIYIKKLAIMMLQLAHVVALKKTEKQTGWSRSLPRLTLVPVNSSSLNTFSSGQ